MNLPHVDPDGDALGGHESMWQVNREGAEEDVMGVARFRSRRAALVVGMATLGLLLTGCFGGGPDVDTVQQELQAAVESESAYVDGTVKFQDGFSQGTSIRGSIVVNATTREQTEQALTRIHEAVARAYFEQPDVDKAFVLLRAYPPGNESAVVESADVVTQKEGVNVTTDDLAALFGLS